MSASVHLPSKADGQETNYSGRRELCAADPVRMAYLCGQNSVW